MSARWRSSARFLARRFYSARGHGTRRDKLPQTPPRTAPLGVIARIVTGGIAGACVAAAGAQGILPGAVLGPLPGVSQAILRQLVKALGTKEIYIALIEDLVAIAGLAWAVTQF